jgi:hypothetical protein
MRLYQSRSRKQVPLQLAAALARMGRRWQQQQSLQRQANKGQGVPGKRLVEVKAAMMAARSLEISQLQHEVGGGAILVGYFGVLQSYTSSTEGARSLEIGLQRAAEVW